LLAEFQKTIWIDSFLFSVKFGKRVLGCRVLKPGFQQTIWVEIYSDKPMVVENNSFHQTIWVKTGMFAGRFAEKK